MCVIIRIISGISTDGTDDGEIHCLKENGIVAAARPAIEQATAALLAPRDALLSMLSLTNAALEQWPLLNSSLPSAWAENISSRGV